jgi:hypothetical protein
VKRFTLLLLILILFSCAGTKQPVDSGYSDGNLPSTEEFNDMHEQQAQQEQQQQAQQDAEYQPVEEAAEAVEESVEYEMDPVESAGDYYYDVDSDGIPDIMDEEPSHDEGSGIVVLEEAMASPDFMEEEMAMEMVEAVEIEEMDVIAPPPSHSNGSSGGSSDHSNGSKKTVSPILIEDSDPVVADAIMLENSSATALETTEPVVDPDELDMNTGSMVYDIPLNMQVGKAHTVKLRISRKKNNNIAVGFTNDTTVYEIETSGVMEVKLFDPNPEGVNKQFEIVSLTDGIQALENDERWNEWTWGVTPIRAGEGKLKLIINIKKKTDFGDMNRSITVFEKDIEIKSNHKYFVRKFFYDNWEWFASSIAIPLSIFAWKRREDIMKIFKKSHTYK